MMELLFFPLCAVIAAAVSAVLRATRPHWSRLRINLIAAAPLPGVVMALCAYVFVMAAVDTKEHCGVDACGMAMGFSMIVGFAAFGAFLMSLAIAAIVQRLMRRP